MAAFSCEDFWNTDEDYWSEKEEIKDDKCELGNLDVISYHVPFFPIPNIFIVGSVKNDVVERNILPEKVCDGCITDRILVTTDFEVKNGLDGIQRNICVELMCFSNNHKKIRSIVGMNENFFKWTKTSFFKWKINSVMPKIVTDLSVQNQDDVIIGKKTVSILKCSNCTGWTWVFLEKVLEPDSGVYSMFIRCVKPSFFNVAVGVMAVSDARPFGDGGDETMYAKYHCHGELFQKGSSYGNHPWKEKDIVGLELDTAAHTLCFSVNGTCQPVSYAGVPARVLFAVCQLCRYANGYMLDGPVSQQRYVRYGVELHVSSAVQGRLSGRGDELEFLAFARHRAGASPLRCYWPLAPVYDPDRFGYKARVVDWNGGDKRLRR